MVRLFSVLIHCAILAAAGDPSPVLDTNKEQSPFGPNVMVFDPTMDRASMQETLDALHEKQAQAEFSDRRFALLFKPGDYELDLTVDYYVQAAGLGRVPGDVRINGTVQSIATDAKGNVTTKFWRSAENFTVRPKRRGQGVYWAVSQAAPYRRMHILGDLHLDRRRWASGGFLANSVVEGSAGLVSGQQWFTRNSELGSWRGGNWNRTFVGTTGTPSTPWPRQPNTVVTSTPVIRDKPFFTIDEDGDFAVFVPALERETRGVTWRSGQEAGRHVPVNEFHIAFPGDTAASMNAAVSNGKHLLLTPGVYQIDEAIRVNRADMIVLGLGFATLAPQTGRAALITADVPGISIASIIVDAGPENSPVLIEIGPTGADGENADNPILLSDVFCRVGGAAVGRAGVCLTINSHHVIVDHAWLWRADHGIGVGWDENTSKHGLVVNGDDVTIYGLFNEHFQAYQTLWNGERGRVYFYQSEIPYDPPNQDRWMAGEKRGFASYKVADEVTQHEAWGLGIYSFFNVRGDEDLGVRLESAVEAPDKPGVRFNHVTTFAGGFGGIDHPINALGSATNVSQVRFFDGLRSENQKSGHRE